MNEKKYKGMVIGCGAIGALLESDPMRPKPATHAGAVQKHPAIELVALVEQNQGTLDEASHLFPGIATYTDIATALAETKPDLVSIATPAKTHKSVIALCAEAGVKIIVCEKPLAESSTDAEEIEHIVRSRDITLVLNYQRRFFTLFQNIQKGLNDGQIGKLQRVTCIYSNGLYNNGGHAIDAVLFLLQESTMTPEAAVYRDGVHPVGDVQVDAFLRTDQGVPVTLMSLDQEKYGIHDIHLYGEKGAYIISDYGYTSTFIPVMPSLFVGVSQLSHSNSKTEHSEESMVAAALQEAIDSFEQKREPRSGIINGRAVTSILDAIAACAAQNKTV